MNILFVCTGNTCRSPMAEVIASDMVRGDDIHISSAGIAAWDGSPASPESIECVRNLGLSLEGFRSRAFTQTLADISDLILTMTRAHKEYILKNFADTDGKTFTLGEYAGEPFTISDPFGLGYKAYERCAAEITRLVKSAAVKWNQL